MLVRYCIVIALRVKRVGTPDIQTKHDQMVSIQTFDSRYLCVDNCTNDLTAPETPPQGLCKPATLQAGPPPIAGVHQAKVQTFNFIDLIVDSILPQGTPTIAGLPPSKSILKSMALGTPAIVGLPQSKVNE